MPFDSGLKPEQKINNSRLSDIFKCSRQGGMRRSLETNTLILIVNHENSLYHHRWQKNILLFTGMGRSGDQDLSQRQNRTLVESNHNGVTVFLFDIFETGVYTFRGQVVLAEKPYQEEQPDKNGQARKVWIFPLKMKTGEFCFISEEEYFQYRKQNVEAKAAETDASEVKGNPYVDTYARWRAGGSCQLCEQAAPFIGADGEPFLEIHQLEVSPRSEQYTIHNVVALCPNCHRKIHELKREEDINTLKQKIGGH